METKETEINELWILAESVLEKVKKGEIISKKEQLITLQKLIEGYQSFIDSEFELKRGMIGLMYERHIYITKLLLLEKLGVRNKWNHPLLSEVKDILYEESDDFQVYDFMATQE